jgi:hypothetical protein
MNSRIIGGHFTNYNDPARALAIIEHCRFGSVTLFKDAIQLAPDIVKILPDCLILLRPVHTEADGMPPQTFGTTPAGAYELGRSHADLFWNAAEHIVAAAPDGHYLGQYQNEVQEGAPGIVGAYFLGYMLEFAIRRELLEIALGRSIDVFPTILDAGVGHYGPELLYDPDFAKMMTVAANSGAVLNYHGYSGPRNQLMTFDSYWYSARMQMLKKRAAELNVPWPEVIHGESTTYYGWRDDLGKRHEPVIKVDPGVLRADIIAFADLMAGSFLASHVNLYNFLDPAGWPEFELSDQQGILDAVRAWNIIHDVPQQQEGGQTMTWDRHAEYDAYQVSMGGPGFNPNDAFGKIRAANPTQEYGVFLGPYRTGDEFITAWTTEGIFWYRKSNNSAGFARSEGELPLA